MEKGLRDRQWSMTGGSSVCVTCSVRDTVPLNSTEFSSRLVVGSGEKSKEVC